MIIAIIILSIALICSLYANYNILKKYERGEEYITNLETWFVQFSKTITNMNKEMEKIDKRGAFSSDDEDLFEIIKILKALRDLLFLRLGIKKFEN